MKPSADAQEVGRAAQELADARRLVFLLVDYCEELRIDRHHLREARNLLHEKLRPYEVEELRAAFDRNDPAPDALYRENVSLRAERDNLAKERDEAIREREQWRAACDEVRDERNKLSEAFKDAIADRDDAREERDDLAKRFREAIAERDNLDDERKKLIGAVGERQTLLQSIAQQAWPEEHAPFRWEALEKLPDRVRAFRVLWEDKKS